MDRVKKCQINKIFKCRVITLLRVQIFILPRNHFCKLNFQIFKIKFLTKIWKSSRKMKLLVLNRITRVFSIIYFMIKTRLNWIQLLKWLQVPFLIVKWPFSNQDEILSRKIFIWIEIKTPIWKMAILSQNFILQNAFFSFMSSL